MSIHNRLTKDFLTPTLMIATLGGYQAFSEDDFKIVAKQIASGNEDALQEYILLQDTIFLAGQLQKSKDGLGSYEQFIKPELIEFLIKTWGNKQGWATDYLLERGDQEDFNYLDNLFDFVVLRKNRK